MAIIMAPLMRVTTWAVEGRVLRTVRARTPTARWTTAHAVRCIVLSSPVCAATGQRARAATPSCVVYDPKLDVDFTLLREGDPNVAGSDQAA